VPGLDSTRVGGDLATPVEALISRAPLFVMPDATVAETARAMRDAGTSSVLIAGEPLGIVTDRDLRSRVLAADLDPDTPVRAVMSRPLRSLPADTTVFGALLWRLEQGFHHLPLTRGGLIAGVVTDTDLLRHQATSPLALLRRIEALDSATDALAGYAGEVAAVAEALLKGGLDVLQIARVITTLNDALTVRLLRRAESALGTPPCPYAWLTLGSGGRTEQVLLSDQDNALAYLEDTESSRAYFDALAARVVAGLIAAGFPRCPGGYMATNWRRSLAEWRALFRGWVEVPEPQALLEAEVFMDFRSVHGELALEPLDAILASAGRRGLFLHQLARAALSVHPSLGAFGRLRRDHGTIDLKAGGIATIVMLARLHALAAGATPRPTLDRLDAAADAGTLSRGGSEALADTFRFLTRLRLREQLRSLHAGATLGNRIDPDELSAFERRRLKEALRAVRRQQEATGRRFRATEAT
jgi:CBS domain-containing protein